MARGGARQGSGAKKGSKHRQRAEIESRLAELGCDPLAGLVAIAQDEKTATDVKARVLIELASYVHSKQRPTARPVTFKLDTMTLPEVQAAQVLTAMAEGKVPLDDGTKLLEAVAQYVNIARDSEASMLLARLAIAAGEPLPASLRLRVEAEAQRGSSN